MKEISEVIKEYDSKLKAEEMIEIYSDFRFKVTVLLKNDLCKIEELNNFDEYTEVKEYVIPVIKNNKHYRLYINNKTKEYCFISKVTLYSSGFAGSIIKTEHISDIDAELVLNMALEEQKLKNNKVSSFSDVLFIVGIIVILLGIFTFFLTIEEGFLSIVLTAAFLVVALMLFALGTILNNLKVIYDKISKLEEK